MSVVPLYAALLALIFVFLSVRTLRLRRKYKIGLGPGDNEVLTRAMRVHANFAEYVPLALLLLFFLESTGQSASYLHLLGIVLVVGRLSHAYGVSQIKENYRFRVAGMVCTFVVLIGAAVRLLFGYLGI